MDYLASLDFNQKSEVAHSAKSFYDQLKPSQQAAIIEEYPRWKIVLTGRP